jgi:hypothetical protein
MNLSDKHDPLDLLRAINPASAVALQGELTLEQHVGALDRAIALGTARAGAPPERRARRRLSRPRLFGLTAIASAGAAAAALLLLGGSPVGPREPEFAGAAVKVAETSPRLLVGAPGWSLTYVNESNFNTHSGQVRFSDGEAELDVNWMNYPGDYPRWDLTGPNAYLHELGQWYRVGSITCAGVQSQDACSMYERNTEVPFLDSQAVMNETQSVYDDGRITHRFTVIDRTDGTELMVSGQADSSEQFLDLLGTIYAADVDTWLEALPPRFVKPLERPEVVDEMLADVPIPASIDVEELKSDQSSKDRYQLGAEVTGAVACAWLDQWGAAVQSGDKAAADEAVQAMSTSRDWAILKEMAKEGGFSQVVWEYSRDMEHDNQHALLDGGVFTYGAASFLGSTGAMTLNAPIVGIAGL